jgi:S-adenosylmethionine hydrolase
VAPDTVFFLSDYGTKDEFVGVVHAVLIAATPGLTIIDLTHQVPPFDVRAGAHALVRAIPYLGPGVVLAVVDPGVGSGRRGLCIEVAPGQGHPTCFIGPDNGLLVQAAELVGEAPIVQVFELDRRAVGSTFDGRDLFAPAAAALCRGVPVAGLGDQIDPRSLVRLVKGVVERGQLADGRWYIRAEVTWVDHFGNLQLAASFADAQIARVPLAGKVSLVDPAVAELRCVEIFADLMQDELGLIVDSNAHLAIVAGQGSAAHGLGVGAGERVTLAW